MKNIYHRLFNPVGVENGVSFITRTTRHCMPCYSYSIPPGLGGEACVHIYDIIPHARHFIPGYSYSIPLGLGNGAFPFSRHFTPGYLNSILSGLHAKNNDRTKTISPKISEETKLKSIDRTKAMSLKIPEGFNMNNHEHSSWNKPPSSLFRP
jgi:hypothetical protein